MSEIKHGLPAWYNGLIIFLFTPALLFLIITAFIALAVVIVLVLILNMPLAIWCAITGQQFEYKFWSMNQKQTKEKSRE